MRAYETNVSSLSKDDILNACLVENFRLSFKRVPAANNLIFRNQAHKNEFCDTIFPFVAFWATGRKQPFYRRRKDQSLRENIVCTENYFNEFTLPIRLNSNFGHILIQYF